MSSPFHTPSRRQFLGTSVSAAGVAAWPGLAVSPSLRSSLSARPEPITSILDPRVETLVKHALDVARSAGATYADVRITYTKERSFDPEKGGSPLPLESERLGAGVRALVDGYWGFASSPVWGRTEMERLAREAVRQAKVNGLNKPRETIMPGSGLAVRGHWETPVKIDAFTVHPLEVRDRLDGLQEELLLELARMGKFGIQRSISEVTTKVAADFMIQEKAFGSTDGSYVTQRLHRTYGEYNCGGQFIGPYAALGGNVGSRLDITGAGWEIFERQPLLDLIRQEIEASAQLSLLPVKPLDVGRYNAVFDAKSVAHLLSTTIGAATEIDRALGYEANAGGTSYLNAPDSMIGAFTFGNNQLTVTANRTEAGGAATVRWDDEGVAPETFTLVKNGVLQDFHTSREGAGWLKDAYARTGGVLRSHGCAFTESAQVVPMIHTANLVMQPGPEAVSLQDLEAQMGTGISVARMGVDPDFQCAGGGASRFPAWEIKGGKRVAHIAGAGILFRTLELWKNMMALGGSSAAMRYGVRTSKGEPVQPSYHSATAVPIMVRDVAFVDFTKR